MNSFFFFFKYFNVSKKWKSISAPDYRYIYIDISHKNYKDFFFCISRNKKNGKDV